MDDSDQLERIRAKAYAIASAGGPDADQARRILSKLPKIKVGRREPVRGGVGVHGELAGGDIGAELPPTPDEEVGIPNQLAEQSLPQKAALAILSPSSRREFERGADKMLTFGLGQKVAGKIGRALGDKPDVDLQATEATDIRESPNARTAGELSALLSGKGLAGAASKVGRAVMSPLASAGKGILGKGLAGAVAGAGANEIAMPLIAGGQEAVEGKNPLPAMKEQALNPVNAAAGALLGFGSGAARGLRESGQVGRDIRLVEEYGAKPTPFGGASGGQFDSPIMQGVEGSTREAGAMARKAARNVLGGLDEEQAGLSRDYGAAKKAAGDAGFIEARIDPLFVREEADRLLRGERVTNSQRAAIESEVVGALDRHPQGMSLDDFNDFRAKLGDIFGTGPGEASHPALDRLRQAAKRTVDETEMGPINQRYHEGTTALDKKYEQLKLTRNTNPRVAEERVAGQILRRGDNTPTAGIQEPAVEEFLQANPKYRPLFDTISLLNAKERMSLGLEGHGGSLYTRLHGALHHNIEPLQVGAYRLGKPLEKGAPAAALAAQLLLNGGPQ